ncbi:glycosyltransferase family 4 protein [Methylomusa anaerophila]|nr:glycosyltransferase family 4 protein [Methylomusa anaerophila]
MGGGVGNVISRLATCSDGRIIHKIVLLEEPVKNNFVEIAKAAGVPILIRPDNLEMENSLAISDIDIIVVHWWHHPRIAKFLHDLPRMPMRLIIWSHISNLTVPALNPNLLLASTRVLFTTEASYEAEVFANLPKNVLKDKAGLVYGCGGFDDFPKIDREQHSGFNIGYLGLVGYSKLHPDFVDFCDAVNIPAAKFILAGDAPAKQQVDRQIREKNIKNPFIYIGYVNDIKPVLAQFDVFGYPLMPYHTCTTENAILEAMAAEVPPVVLNQLTEKYIVQDGKTGILVSGREEYGQAMNLLYNNPEFRRFLGKNAREHVLSKFTLKKLSDSFYRNCEIAMQQPKQILNFRKHMGNSPAEWFISCLGKDCQSFKISMEAEIFNQTENIKKLILSTSPLLKQSNKSSVFHYQREYPGDAMLKTWAEIIGEGEMRE